MILDIGDDGLQHYGRRFRYQVATQTDFRAVPKLPEGHPLSDMLANATEELFNNQNKYRKTFLRSAQLYLSFAYHNRNLIAKQKDAADKEGIHTCWSC